MGVAGRPREALLARARAQLPEAERDASRDLVIANEGTRDDLLAAADRLAARLGELGPGTGRTP